VSVGLICGVTSLGKFRSVDNFNKFLSLVKLLGQCSVRDTKVEQGRPKAPRQRIVRHGNPRGDESKKVRGTKCVDVYV